MKENMRVATNGLTGIKLLGAVTLADTFKGHSRRWFMALLLIVLMAGCNGTNPSLNGGTNPAVNATVPVDGAHNVAVASTVTATFSKKMDADTITTSTFTLKESADSTAVTGTVALSADGLTATFTAAGLSEDTDYTATITTGAKDIDGNALRANKIWSFTTGPAPTVTATTPTDGQPVATAITATFSEAMDPDTITTSTFTVEETADSTAVTDVQWRIIPQPMWLPLHRNPLSQRAYLTLPRLQPEPRTRQAIR